MFAHVKRVYGWLVGAGLVLFALAWIPNDSSLAWLATIGWFGMMLASLGLILFTLALAVRALMRRRASASGR
jgi:hypothetical protein